MAQSAVEMQRMDQPRAAVLRVNILDLLEYDGNNHVATLKLFAEVSWQEPELLQVPDLPRNTRWNDWEQVPRHKEIKKTVPFFATTKVINTRLTNLIEDVDFIQYFVVKDDKDEPEDRFASLGIGSEVPILSWCAVGTGKFQQTLDFYAYPFDQQSIGVSLRMADKRMEQGFRVLENNRRPCSLANSSIEGWHMETGKQARLTFNYKAEERDHVVTFSFTLARAPMFYVINFVVPPALVTLLGIITFALPCEDLADRSLHICEMFLTQTVFKSTLTEYVPKISYLTYLDKYIFLQSILLIWAALTQTWTFLFQRDEEHPLTELVMLGLIVAIWTWALLDAACRARRAHALARGAS